MRFILSRFRSALPLVFPLLLLLLFSCRQKDHNGLLDKQQLSGRQAAPSSALRRVTVYPYWVTTCQFAGFYVGKEKGIFRKYGIDLNILEYKPFYSTNEIITSGKADFAILWLVNAIQLRSSGINIVNIAQFSTRSSLMLIAKKSSGIRKIADLEGKRAGIWDGYELQPRTLFNKYGLNVKIIPIGSTNNLFLQGGVDVTNANWFDEYHAIINSGYNENELIHFFFADYGLNFLEDGIYCLEEKMKSDPKICVDFVKATVESWQYVFEHPEETVNIILQKQKDQKMAANRSHQKWMVERYRDLYLPKGRNTLNIILSRDDYMSNARILLQNNQISNIPPYEEFFKAYAILLKSSYPK